MAQRSGGRKQAPTYSADTLALRMIAGLALVALGVLIFMAVDLRMTGNIFEGLRRVCCGLCGSLAMILAAVPLWAGILVIWSTQRKPPVRPWIYFLICFFAVSGFIMLISGNAMEHLHRQYGGTWGGVVSGAFQDCARTGTGGGGLGASLAWPLWRFLGNIIGSTLLFLLTVFCALMAVGMTPIRLRELITGQAGRIKEDQQQQRNLSEQEQMAWQQEQALRQAAWQQKQARIIEQQQMAQQQVQQPGAGYSAPVQGPAPVFGNPERTGRNSSVAAWQDQLTARQTAAVPQAGWLSRIFNRPPQERPADEAPARRKGIFGTSRDEYDGLSDGSTLRNTAGEQAARQLRAEAERKPRRTVTGEEIGKPETRWTIGQDQAPGVSREPLRQETDVVRDRVGGAVPQSSSGQNGRRELPFTEENREAGKAEPQEASVPRSRIFDRRETDHREAPAEDQDAQELAAELKNRWGRGRAGEASNAEALAAELRNRWGRGQADETMQSRPQETDSVRERVSEAAAKSSSGQNGRRELPFTEEEERKQEQRPALNRNQQEAKRENAQPPKPAVPAVQMTVGVEAYKPALKVPPKAENEIDAPGEAFWEPTPYYAPPLTDLARPAPSQEDTAAEDEMRSRRLEETLQSFRVTARVVHVTHGPAISRFELELAAGTKVNKVAELEKDIAYGMEATSVRIEAPIPGKSLVGVEVPNRKVSMVTLREVMESERMQNAKSLLTVALGKDIAGTPIICDLAKMPHMLIAGQTGSGKSVCINTIINSLLFRASPDEVKLILVDPKVVELQCYNGIPHLLIPVVNDPHKAAAALAWAVAEMMERYDRFAERKVRNLDGYNAILGPHEQPMSRIVIIIDELADLMMVCKKDVEEYICRLTQLARAAGIHLIVATQRPSVDVITGLIKANIPSRIAFKTASAVDSRTILDRGGADQLLGWGDMLYLPTGSFAPTRVQGCFLSDEEVNRIASHVREANPSSYDPNILEKLEEISGGGEAPGMDMITGGAEAAGGDENLFDQAVEYAINDGQISTSTLQRRLKIGYARAGRLTDEMEERGIIAAKDGSKPRKCLITREEWDALKKTTEGMNP